LANKIPLALAEDLWEEYPKRRLNARPPGYHRVVLLQRRPVKWQYHAAYDEPWRKRERKCRICLDWIRDPGHIEIMTATMAAFIHSYPCVTSGHEKAAAEARRARPSTPKPHANTRRSRDEVAPR